MELIDLVEWKWRKEMAITKFFLRLQRLKSQLLTAQKLFTGGGEKASDESEGVLGAAAVFFFKKKKE